MAGGVLSGDAENRKGFCGEQGESEAGGTERRGDGKYAAVQQTANTHTALHVVLL